MRIYTDIIDKEMLMKYEKIAACYVRAVIDMVYRQKFKEFGLDVIITTSHDDVPCGNTLYNVTLFVEPLYKNERIFCRKGKTRGYTSFVDIINYRLTEKGKKGIFKTYLENNFPDWFCGSFDKQKKEGKFQVYLEDNFSDLFSGIEDALINLKTGGMEIDTDGYPERKIFL